MPNCWAWQIATNLNISNSIETAVDHIRILEALETIKNWRTKKKPNKNKRQLNRTS